MVVVEVPDGTTDFNELERELGRKDSARLVLYVFDLLYVDGWDLRGAGLLDRKRVLAELVRDLPENSPIKYSEHMEADGAAMQRQACKLGLEGIVSKRKDGRYSSDRSDLWIKTPCRRRDTFVIAGWAQKGTKFDGFYLGEEHNGELVYAGKIEGGWTEDQKDALLARVKPLQISRPRILLPVAKPKAR
jgi:bifunctional non-homologous end joining protein LigD